jgi:hypothetical protein
MTPTASYILQRLLHASLTVERGNSSTLLLAGIAVNLSRTNGPALLITIGDSVYRDFGAAALLIDSRLSELFGSSAAALLLHTDWFMFSYGGDTALARLDGFQF